MPVWSACGIQLATSGAVCSPQAWCVGVDAHVPGLLQLMGAVAVCLFVHHWPARAASCSPIGKYGAHARRYTWWYVRARKGGIVMASDLWLCAPPLAAPLCFSRHHLHVWWPE